MDLTRAIALRLTTNLRSHVTTTGAAHDESPLDALNVEGTAPYTENVVLNQ